MRGKISRRLVLRGGPIASCMIPLLAWPIWNARAATLAPLDPGDPTAKALGFVVDSTKVNASANPTYKPMQKCGSCAQFQGKAGEATGGCNIFAGHSVPQGGWCKVWAQKPAP